MSAAALPDHPEELPEERRRVSAELAAAGFLKVVQSTDEVGAEQGDDLLTIAAHVAGALAGTDSETTDLAEGLTILKRKMSGAV